MRNVAIARLSRVSILAIRWAVAEPRYLRL